MKISQFICFAICSLFYWQAVATDFNVLDYGAKADGVTVDTRAVQDAIDACTKNGGGRVLIPAGKTVVTGTIYLKDFVTLHIENGATLLGSPNYRDYATDTHKNMYKNEPHMDRCLIFAKDARSIAIEGYGTIDGNGHQKNFNKKKGGRPMMIRFVNVKDIHLNNITLINPAAWTSAWLYCDNISVSGITIISRVNNNGDGLDFDGCTNVRVTNSNFDNSDDSICLQASRPDKPCKNITVSNCHFSTKWGGMRIGLLSRGNIESVTVTNCTFKDIQDSGLKIQQCEGGEMKNMVFSNLVMENVPRPIFMTFAQQRASVDTPEGQLEPLKSMHNFSFSNIVVDNSKLDKNSTFFLTGFPGHRIEDITITDVQFTVSGGGTVEDAQKTDLKEYTQEVLNGWWPEFSLVGTLPASGLYARHINGLVVDNFSIKTINEDQRAPIVLKNVENVEVNRIYLNKKKLSKDQIQNN
ncbi:glycoside hydrolase family 28 protein [Zobellia galactanivorans]|uniref:glycoside hydrolase family 28 protein n=1 Tax=Zobellia galactanivorans (strain DSM 12802 / CCUG 47099 / CIP 106680 / NCIMB 13871 / Dsij) TaxID=63186 RepID=UPI001C075CA5|nr:glycoside hydrolase family 28 protein [Zobellia galactanivorans]MBU3024282.1 glycoside hydrolase family 28 protein [Zobellia galactanivorans]